MVGTKLPEDILHEIEEDLRQDQDLWKHIHTDLHALGAPPARARPRTRWIALGAVASVVALFAAFALGWQVAPGTTEEVAVTKVMTVAPLPGIAEAKYEVLAGLHGVPVVAPVPEAAPLPGIAEAKYEVLAGLHGVPVVAPVPEAAPLPGIAEAKYELLATLHGVPQGTEPGSAERFRVAWNEAKAEALAS
jgi:hypothetical protein